MAISREEVLSSFVVEMTIKIAFGDVMTHSLVYKSRSEKTYSVFALQMVAIIIIRALHSIK
jgi:hypothetical protein